MCGIWGLKRGSPGTADEKTFFIGNACRGIYAEVLEVAVYGINFLAFGRCWQRGQVENCPLCIFDEKIFFSQCFGYKKMFTKSEEDDIMLPGWYSEKKLYLITIILKRKVTVRRGNSYAGACIA